MLDGHFVLLAAAVDFAGVSRYAWDTLKGKTEPNRVTWALWAVVPLVAFGAEIGDGVGWQSLLTFTVGAGPLIVFLASFVNRRAYAAITVFDIACGATSLVAMGLWAVTRTGTIAIAFSVVADALASAPTVLKAWRRPESETATAYILGAVAATITMLTVPRITIDLAAFPIYVALIDLSLASIITIRTRTGRAAIPAGLSGTGPAHDVPDPRGRGSTPRRVMPR